MASKSNSVRSKIYNYEQKKLQKLLLFIDSYLKEGKISPQTATAIKIDTQKVLTELKRLDKQISFYNPEADDLPPGVEVIKINTPELGEMAIKIMRLQGVGQQQSGGKRVPTIINSGWAADFKSVMALQMSLALEGVDTIGVAMPEHYTSKVPVDWGKRIKDVGDYSLHAKIVIEMCKQLKIKEIDLTGYSTGAAIALATAFELTENRNLGINVRNLDVLNPTGFLVTRSVSLATSFILEGIKTAFIPDAVNRSIIVQRLKLKDWKTPGMWSFVTHILAKKIFTPSYLSKIHTSGRCNTYISLSDLVSRGKLVKQEIEKTRRLYPQTQLKVIEILNGDHGMMVHAAAGFAASFAKNIPIKDKTSIREIPATQADLIAEKYQLALNS